MFSELINSVITGVYFTLISIMIFLGVFGVYVLLKYGERKSVSIIAIALFCFFFLSLLLQSYSTYNKVI